MSPSLTRSPDVIPGYTIRQRIGAGGYGEVWKADAPGGLEKAIKFVYGYLDEQRAACELKALGRIKEVHHPFLLSLERIEVVDGQLVIVTELAEASLKDRFEQCREKGLPGIPRDELLVYLADAADALDYMCTRFSLQHLDIKPENLLIIGGRVKVADFGLVKDVQEATVSLMGGLTPVYAAPEVFQGHPSRHSDQYSLAIVYQELLTGVLPFPGKTPGQLAAQHAGGNPRLMSLVAADRPIIARALAKTAEERFPSCRSLLDALLAQTGSVHQGHSPLVEVESRPGVGDTAAVMGRADTEAKPAAAEQRSRDLCRTMPFEELVPEGESSAKGSSWTAALLAERASELAERVANATWPLPIGAPAAVVDAPPSERAAGARPLQPTLVIGIGGVAGRILTRLGQRWAARLGSREAMPGLGMLLIDSDRRALVDTAGSGVFQLAETLAMPLRHPDEYRGAWEKHLRWLSRRWLCNIPRSLVIEGRRPLGRLALLDHASELRSRLDEALCSITSPEALAALSGSGGTGSASSAPRIVVVAAVSGGTGSGMALDVAYAARQMLAERACAGATVSGVLLYASRRGPSEKLLAMANACACLSEMDRYGRHGYAGATDFGLKATMVAPFDDTAVVPLGDGISPHAFDCQADDLATCLDLATASPDGGLLEPDTATKGAAGETTVRTFQLGHPDDSKPDAEPLVKRAAPSLAACGGMRRFVAIGPNADSATALGSALEPHQAASLLVDSQSELALWCGIEGIPLAQVAARLIDNRADAARLAARVHVRTDISLG